MRLRIPPVAIDESNPLNSLFANRCKFGTSLHSLLQNSEDGFVVMVDGQWGQGKSTFIRAFRQHVRIAPVGEAPPVLDGGRLKPDTILFDAFAHDADEDPLASFCSAIAAFSKEIVPAEVHGEFLKKSTAMLLGVASAFTSKLVGAGATAACLSQGGDPSISAGVGAGSAAGAKAVMDGAKASVLAALDGFARFDESEEGFGESLEALATAYKTHTGFPLTVIVDELDRCSPSYALRLIERIKRFFEVDSLCFLLFANVSQLERQIEKEYGAIDSANYLRKFADVRMNFPDNHQTVSRGNGSNAFGYARTLRKELNCGFHHFSEVWDGFESFVNPLRLSLREVEAVARQLMLVEASAGSMFSLIGPLAALRVKNNLGYERLKAMELDALGLFALFGVDPSVKLPYRTAEPLVELASIFLGEEEFRSFCQKAETYEKLGWIPDFGEGRKYLSNAIESLEVFKL